MKFYDKKFYLCEGYQIKKTDRPIIYFHIPKCGGTTVCNILRYLFSYPKRIYGPPTGKSGSILAFESFLSNKNKYLNANLDFLYGHFQYSIAKNFPNMLSITAIRNPIERSISHYNMIVEKVKINQKVSLKKWFEDSFIPANIMTQILSCDNHKDTKINSEKYERALNVLTNEIDIVFDSKNIFDLLNLIISLYDLPNLFFQNLQKTKKELFYKYKRKH